jgi:uncharacterized OsmC-like protein
MTENTMTLRERQAPLKARYQAEPDSALKTLRVRSSTVGDDPTRVRIRTEAGGETPVAEWEAAAHAMAGGPDDLACSGDLLLASLAACQEITVRMVAAAMGITLDALEVTVEGDMDFRGTMGVDPEAPVGLTAIRTHIALTADAPADRLERLAQRAERYCVVASTLRNPPELSTVIDTRTRDEGNTPHR